MPVPRRCLTCSAVFDTLIALRVHCSARSHTLSPYICNPCNRSFATILALQNHLNSRRHANDPVVGLSVEAFEDGRDDNGPEIAEGSDGNHPNLVTNCCPVCERDFKSAHGLELHTASLAHCARVLPCPFCRSKYKSPSGMAMHLENNCKSGVTRHQVTNAVHSMEFTPDISIGQSKSITAISTSNESLTTTSQLFATEASFNGSHYICPFIVDCRQKKFKSLHALNRHLSSPAHDDDQFKCPGCHTVFKLISGFIQHIETRICVDATGSVTFEQIETQIENLAHSLSNNLILRG